MTWRAAVVALLGLGLSAAGTSAPAKIELRRDDPAGRLQILIAGREAIVYQYAATLDLPHYWPLRSPSGKNMLAPKVEPYPHHRSFWFADTVKLDGGRQVSVYNALYTGKKTGENTYDPPFADRIRHRAFGRLEAEGERAVVEADLVWEMDGDKPVLDERRSLNIQALANGEYFCDIKFILTAAHGDVEFVSDEVHYAWPFLRIQAPFNGEGGGKITADNGATGQEATNLKPALWIDYSGTADGAAEGLAVFQWPDGREHRWLTREYGTFGPRRPDEQSGKPFTLKKGESITQRVGVLVHRGNAMTGRIAERYRQYVKGESIQ